MHELFNVKRKRLYTASFFLHHAESCDDSGLTLFALVLSIRNYNSTCLKEMSIGRMIKSIENKEGYGKGNANDAERVLFRVGYGYFLGWLGCHG